MSETNFFGLSRGRYDPLASTPRPLKVPERPVERLTAPPARQVHRSGAMDMVAKPKLKVVKPEPKLTPTPKPEVKDEPNLEIKPASPIIPVDDLLNDFIDNKPKIKKTAEVKSKIPRPKLAHKLAARKIARAKVKAAKAAAKQTVKVANKAAKPKTPRVKIVLQTPKLPKIAKTPKVPKAPKPPKVPKMPKKAKVPKSALYAGATSDADFTARALTAAADTTPVATTTPTSLAMNNSGEVAVENRLPRVTFDIKINKRHVFAFVRAIIVAAILAVSGYLAWDTWLVNKTLQGTVSNPVAAVAIDEIAPSGVDTTSISNQAWAAYTVPADQARYIYLPTVNSQARVLSVGINSKGKIDTAENVNDTAWYDGSAKPGQEGQVFINGHTASSSTYRAAFDNLAKLQIGDQIIIERGDGEKISYRVVNNETIPASKVDMQKVLNVPNGAARGLTLMSCTGKFNYRTQSSDTRVIVYAVQE